MKSNIEIIFTNNNERKIMSYSIANITFVKYDDDGNEICDLKGNVKQFTFKDHIDCSYIVDSITDDEVEEI
jgi:hypothetical protein